jgi:hypothetical protein
MLAMELRASKVCARLMVRGIWSIPNTVKCFVAIFFT